MFCNPLELVKSFHLRNDMAVADFGSGAGRYAIPIAKTIQSGSGKVFAIDIQKEVLATISREAERFGLQNIAVIRGDLEVEHGTKLSDKVIDAVVMANVLFQIEQRGNALTEAARILRPRGELFFIEWSDSFKGIGPAREDVIQKENAKRLLGEHGFFIEKEFPAGSHHYGLHARKK